MGVVGAFVVYGAYRDGYCGYVRRADARIETDLKKIDTVREDIKSWV